MSDTLKYLQDKFDIDNIRINRHGATELPNIGRRGLADMFGELGFKKGVEVGVADGWYSDLMMKANPDVELWGVDPYERQPGYIDFMKSTTFQRMEQSAHAKLDKYPNYHFVRKTSAEALDDFPDGSLDFVYIDGDHCYESVVFDISNWSKKIRKGGIISGHDFAKHKRPGTKIHVVQAVTGFTSSYHIKPWFILGRERNDEGLIRDRIRSWFWVIQ